MMGLCEAITPSRPRARTACIVPLLPVRRTMQAVLTLLGALGGFQLRHICGNVTRGLDRHADHFAMLIRPDHLQDMIVIGNGLLCRQDAVIRCRMSIADQCDIVAQVSRFPAGSIDAYLRLTPN